jgi:hypothetical protein
MGAKEQQEDKDCDCLSICLKNEQDSTDQFDQTNHGGYQNIAYI